MTQPCRLLRVQPRNDRDPRKTDIPFGDDGSELTWIALPNSHATLIPDGQTSKKIRSPPNRACCEVLSGKNNRPGYRSDLFMNGQAADLMAG